MAVNIDNEQDKITIPADWEEKICKVVDLCLQEEGISTRAEVDLMFVDNATIHKMNLDYRNVDRATDVLSFPMYEAEEEFYEDEAEILFGDIVISLERAEEQCQEYGHSLEREVMYLLVHGLLHLNGYDHMEEEEKKVMRAQEEKLLAVIGAIR